MLLQRRSEIEDFTENVASDACFTKLVNVIAIPWDLDDFQCNQIIDWNVVDRLRMFVHLEEIYEHRSF